MWNDTETGEWHRYDERCSACYLNHPHTLTRHLESIALHETWGKHAGPWTHPDSAENVKARQEWIEAHRAEFGPHTERVANMRAALAAAGRAVGGEAQP